MADNEAKVCCTENELKVVLPMTQPTGKIRIKERSFFAEYGVPVAARQVCLGMNHYVEWQIGYDLLANSENEARTSLAAFPFRNYKQEEKFAYELSELLYYSWKKDLLSEKQIRDVIEKIQDVDAEDTFERLATMNISRTNPQEVEINGLPFYKMLVSYPMLVHKFGKYDIYAEVVIKEKQRAVGTQAMLYVCLPLSSLKFRRPVFGRAVCAWFDPNAASDESIEILAISDILDWARRDVIATTLRR